MPQETVDRLQLAAKITFDAQLDPVFIANQGFETAIQKVVDAGIPADVYILRPVELPATPDNMVAYLQEAAGERGVYAELEPGIGLAGSTGLTTPPFAANVVAASQPGDVAVIIAQNDTVENLVMSIQVIQITPAD